MRSLFLGFIVVLLACSLAYAAPVGNPTEPAFLKGNNKGKLSTIVNVLFDRDMKEGGAEIDKGVEYTARLAYNIKNKVELYGLVGGVNGFEIKGDTNFIPGASTDSDIRTALLWGGGATVVIYETDFQDRPLRVGADAKIQSYKTEFDNLIINGVSTEAMEDEYKSCEWQIALGVSYQIDRFVPYAGFKYSDMKIEEEASVNGVSRSKTLNADDLFGLYAGCDWTANDYIKLNAEGRFIDETAVSFGATLTY